MNKKNVYRFCYLNLCTTQISIRKHTEKKTPSPQFRTHCGQNMKSFVESCWKSGVDWYECVWLKSDDTIFGVTDKRDVLMQNWQATSIFHKFSWRERESNGFLPVAPNTVGVCSCEKKISPENRENKISVFFSILFDCCCCCRSVESGDEMWVNWNNSNKIKHNKNGQQNVRQQAICSFFFTE